jgi:hypothetical protein
MKKMLLVLGSSALFALPTCLSVDQEGLAALGGDLVCQFASAGLPFSNHVDYCSVIDIDIPVNDLWGE